MEESREKEVEWAMLYCASYSQGLKQWDRERRRAPSTEEELLQDEDVRRTDVQSWWVCECVCVLPVWWYHGCNPLWSVSLHSIAHVFIFQASGGIPWFLPLPDDLLFSCSALSWQPERRARFTIILSARWRPVVIAESFLIFIKPPIVLFLEASRQKSPLQWF